ncbi:hypothetical protein [Tolypothrix sp. PCC 7601]|uniref:hypothetical protein n=1 Tax=Tolypothrix sp. PCC 7601 TaxID=1188 RepID=UPI0005EAA6CC|nr:hypothetical protein [Tolypothrix sp. PCC 7601]EKE98954.1 hypothetical protein FDUTEX481_03142 [Tolypothrix sp. PCC 7601]UYD35637.1 hypothetical protein HG267_07705 [Tolypothrix sp. PCC 7601]BAY94799.1 hypothetical protein NIES3275_68530 [Microchaete diplosiphon NIES-3275]
MKEHLDIIVSVCVLVGMVWRLALVQAQIYKAIDDARDEIDDSINAVAHKLDLHLIEYGEKKEFTVYRFNGIDEVIRHKFDRCWGEIKQIQNYLAKQGFIPRDHNKSD